MENTNKSTKKKKKSVFTIIFRNYNYCKAIYGFKNGLIVSHEETDDAQIASNVSPVISKISGYVAEGKVKRQSVCEKR